MYTEIEQETLDMDWFFTDGEHIGFVASAGGKLPDSVSILDKENRLSAYFRSLPEISEAIIDSTLGKEEFIYLMDFLNMSKKGLYSFDKTILNDSSDTNYRLVASPGNPLKLNQLPPDILEIIVETRYCNKFVNIQKINVLEIK